MQEDKIGQVFVFVKDISRLEQYRGERRMIEITKV